MSRRFARAAALSFVAIASVWLPGCATQEQITQQMLQNQGSQIAAIEPPAAPPGAQVRIIGTAFGAQPGTDGRVQLLPGSGLQAVNVPFDSWSDTLIYFRVPQVSSTAGMGSRISVTDSKGQVAAAPTAFVVLAAPGSPGAADAQSQTGNQTPFPTSPGSTLPNPFASTFKKRSPAAPAGRSGAK
ncbi:MAG: hypothetical protein HY303_09070 [Candidatus Wallbacteria bacterium]|nr:hypothetical protein [Candidatus Wallbacteria bacterium]